MSTATWEQAFAHPLRVEILRYMLARDAVAPNGLATALDAPLSVVSYHVRKLRDFRIVELVSTAPRRGAVEHRYSVRDRETTRAALRRLAGIDASTLPKLTCQTKPMDDDGPGTLTHALKELRRRRERHGLSRTALARRVGMRPDYLGRIERGEAQPRVAALESLATALGTSLGEVFGAPSPPRRRF